MDTMQPGLHPDPVIDRDMVVYGAHEIGFEFAKFSTASGQTVWEWRRGNEPRPQFATERVAIQWMVEWLERESRELKSPEPETGGTGSYAPWAGRGCSSESAGSDRGRRSAEGRVATPRRRRASR